MVPHALLARRRAEYHHWLRTSPEWAALRRAVLRRDGYTCRLCGDHGWTVHHRDYTQGWLPSPSRLLTCCLRCHSVLHGRLWYLDYDGTL